MSLHRAVLRTAGRGRARVASHVDVLTGMDSRWGVASAGLSFCIAVGSTACPRRASRYAVLLGNHY